MIDRLDENLIRGDVEMLVKKRETESPQGSMLFQHRTYLVNAGLIRRADRRYFVDVGQPWQPTQRY